ncbi:hypothetical protein BDB00DRAFT_879982 [Zychaea mexicana]|uniref:uncharacterized protein n=1 Tax=Zychaea mexicana TaxID=64656 RepID=UPI0022FF0264|nr:uncharacterized protein BDB00DRAFT_879982 [Zychaea mexicana]KAI9471415.1 hypothetical protein BDB00DRAFT_879982 [Zychaea mexicana]
MSDHCSAFHPYQIDAVNVKQSENSYPYECKRCRGQYSSAREVLIHITRCSVAGAYYSKELLVENIQSQLFDTPTFRHPMEEMRKTRLVSPRVAGRKALGLSFVLYWDAFLDHLYMERVDSETQERFLQTFGPQRFLLTRDLVPRMDCISIASLVQCDTGTVFEPFRKIWGATRNVLITEMQHIESVDARILGVIRQTVADRRYTSSIPFEGLSSEQDVYRHCSVMASFLQSFYRLITHAGQYHPSLTNELPTTVHIFIPEFIAAVHGRSMRNLCTVIRIILWTLVQESDSRPNPFWSALYRHYVFMSVEQDRRFSEKRQLYENVSILIYWCRLLTCAKIRALQSASAVVDFKR